jgi:hypothetical protein
MPAFSGKYEYRDEKGAALSQGPAQFSFDAETAILTPAQGAPMAFDLGDIDRFTPAEWDLALTLHTGRALTLRQFGGSFGNLSDGLLAAWRDRMVRCLLLEDMQEIGRFTGSLASARVGVAPSEFRLYQTNIAALPLAETPVQWRLADIDSVKFDESSWTTTLTASMGRISISKLAKRTDEFTQKLEGAISALKTEAADALHRLFPFLNPDQLQRLAALMPEGRSAPLGSIEEIHAKLPGALLATAVSAKHKPFFEALCAHSSPEVLLAGFKFIRGDEETADTDGAGEEGEQDAEAEDDGRPKLFYWFFVPIRDRKIMAWEATTGSGRATYFFRYEGDAVQAAQQLTRGLALVNFRREPVYLPDESLEQQPRFHRYAIGARKLADLRALRAAYLGRAIHTSMETWAGQVERLIG